MCIPCPTGIGCCKKILGACVLPCPTFDSCCTRAPEPVCETANGACAALKEPLLLILEGAKKLVAESKHILDVANAALEAAKLPVQAAQGVLDGANAALEGVKQLYIAGTNAAAAIVKFTLTKILSISEMYFKVELSVANGGKFQCRLKGVLVGQNIDQSFSFDTNDIFGIAKSLAEKAVSGVSKYIG